MIIFCSAKRHVHSASETITINLKFEAICKVEPDQDQYPNPNGMKY